MAKGDYILFNNVPFQSVTSHPRRYGVMFNPSSSRSRFRIIDAGRRYGVRLNADGIVEYSIDGDVTWKTIDSFTDPCTGAKLPEMVTHENLRIGEPLSNIRFDMIAVGRGRIIAKEAGTDRLFHVYMDELFRTYQRLCNPGENAPSLNEDPPIPPFNMKLDPECFTENAPTLVVPPEGTRNYSNHPASLRLAVFNQLLEMDMSDVMLVFERARTWSLKDTRSQLSITAPEDLGFSEDDLRAVYTQPVIRDILESIKNAAREFPNNIIADLLVRALFDTDGIARNWRRQLEEDGYLALVFPAYLVLGGLLYASHAAKAVKRDQATGRIKINMPALLNFVNQPSSNPTAQSFINEAMAKFMEGVGELMLRSRRTAVQEYGNRPDVQRVELPPEWTIENKLPTPNQPPAWMPAYIRTTYTRTKGTGQGVWKDLYGPLDIIRKVWLGTNVDGRLEAFGLGFDNSVWHTSQVVPNGNWKGPWKLVNTNATKLVQLAVARNSDGRLEIFGISSDNRIWHTSQETPNGGWHDSWEELYSSVDRLISITVGQNLDGRLEVFGVGPDNSVWHTSQPSPGQWPGPWQELGGQKMSKVWVASNADGRLEVFGVSPDDRIWHRWQTEPGTNWHGSWVELYSSVDKLRTLAVGRNLDGTLEVFGVGPDQRVWHTAQTKPGGDWSGGWDELYPSGQKLSELWVLTHLDGRLEVFGVLGGFGNDTVWRTYQLSPNGQWNGSWIQIKADGGRQNLAVATNVNGQVEMIGIFPLLSHALNIRLVPIKSSWHGVWKKFFIDADRLHRVWLDTNADGRLEAFGLGPGNTVWHASQEVPNGNWTPSWDALYSSSDQRIELASARNSDGRLELFGVSPDHRVWHTSQSTAGRDWTGPWQELYTSTDKRTSICVASNTDGRLELFGSSPADNTVWRTSQTAPNGPWKGPWEQLYTDDAKKLSSLAVARNLDGRLELFGIAPNNNTIWHTSQAGAGGQWVGPWTELYHDDDKLISLVAGRNQDGRLEVFGIAPNDNTIWHTWQKTPGGDWLGHWDELYSSTDKLDYLWLISNTDGRLELFGIKTDLRYWENRVFHTWQMTPNGNWNGAWAEVEAEGGRRTMAVATNVDGRIELVGISVPLVPTTEFPDDHVWNVRLLAEHRYAIQFSRVLDLGIGSSHWSESWQKHFGGEIHSLLAPRPLFQGERYSLTQYRFLNGPVIDGDAFNDGTTNFYMLVKLGQAGSNGAGLLQRYAILWFDEQTYFTQRWRLVHPTDDVLGDLFSLPHTLRTNPDWYNFSLAKFWSPFRDDLIDDDSRMALRRNIIAVTGINRAAQRHEIFTIVFNYGLCDHSWRWRRFPAGKEVLIDSSIAQDMDPQLPDEVVKGSENAYVIVNTLNLRDDTTLHVRGSVRFGTNPNLRVGRWLQRYLPADFRHVPERHELTGARPAAGFDHTWDFVSEPAYKRADRFYQFGVYEDRLDSRGQYYEIDLLPGPDGVTPRVEDVVGNVWSNDQAGAGEDRLKMNTINFVWSLPKENGSIVKRITADPNNPLDPELLVHEFRKRPSISMYEPTTRFRILERKPLGLIAVFYDKRDDELQAASDLPHPTIFRKDFADADIPAGWKIEDGETPAPPPADRTQASIRVMIKSNRRVVQPPNVRKALAVINKAPGLRELRVSFWTPQTEQEVCENIWKVSLAALDQPGVVPLFSVTRFPNFVRRAVPDGPLPSQFRGELSDAWRYDFTWAFPKEVETNVRRFCTPEGHIEFATSLWFEDILGHRALAQELIFA
jgi:hypothetical protein